jgi:hypothetical protein
VTFTFVCIWAYGGRRRGIDKNIVKLEKELEKIFDDANIDCLEVEYGMLVRRKTATGYEWVVEI